MHLKHIPLKTARFTLLLAGGLAGAAPVPAADFYRIDPSHTYPSFEISHMGFSIQRGFFEKTQGTITLDRENKTGSIEIEIDAASIQTGDAKRDEVLRDEGFLAARHHPKLIYTASQIEFDGDKPRRIKGQLKLRGVTRPVELAVTHFECGFNLLKLANGCGADAVAALQRSDFGIVSFLPSIGDQVWLRIQVEAYK